MATSVAVFFASCSSDNHSTSGPDDEIAAGSSSSVDLDELLGLSSEDETASSSSVAASSKNSSSSKKVGSSASKAASSSSKTSTKKSKLATSCDAEMGDVEKEALDVANSKAMDMFAAVNKKNVDDTRAISAEVNPMYAKILKKYPKSCAAQLGYAVSNLFDLANRGEVAEFVDDVLNAKDERDLGSQDPNVTTVMYNISIMNKYATKWNKTITEKTQEIIATDVLPTLDTSIAYMQNILAHDDYTLEIKSDGKIREIDMSETAPALGLMFATKAVLTMIASVNLEFANNGSYDWIDDAGDVSLMQIGAKNGGEAAAIAFMNETFGKGGQFFVVKDKWTEKWKNIPALLDSALRETRAGLKYSINESYKSGSQDNDIYVVGDGADADISIEDMQDAVAAIDVGLNEILDGPYKAKIKGDLSITFDLKKFFENTKGYEPFLPYYVLGDPYDYDSFYFTDAKGSKTASIREYQINKTVKLTNENVKNKIFFPDPTFGGIFPAFKTQEDIWNFLVELDETL